MPEMFQDVAKIVAGMAAVAVCIWLYLKVLTWLDLHGIDLRRGPGDLDRPSEMIKLSLDKSQSSSESDDNQREPFQWG